MRRAMRSTQQAVLGGQPLLSMAVITAGVATGVLESMGFDYWWALPVLVVGFVTVGTYRRRSRP